ncbi:MAG: PA2169 family four-helix-bundle protein [Brevundimonas sp.]|nr:PA2169 family four-helix-bundle protein [Brevundimonas sp.]
MTEQDISDAHRHDVRVLGRLIKVTLDSAEGYREASRDSKDPGRKLAFGRLAEQRDALVEALQHASRDLGGQPDRDGSLLAKAHRAFMDIKHALLRDDEALDGEIRTGESWLIDTWEVALNDPDLGESTREIIRRAFDVIDPRPGDREEHLLPPEDGLHA